MRLGGNKLLIVFLGGGIGASARALLLAALASWGSAPPVLLVNLLGAFALGMVYVLADEAGVVRADTRLFLAVGVLGGFTTFSTFGWGADVLLAGHETGAAFAYLVASIVGGVAAIAVGFEAGRVLIAALERGAVTLLARLEQRRHANQQRTNLETVEPEDREASA